jgi:hypothetical protein
VWYLKICCGIKKLSGYCDFIIEKYNKTTTQNEKNSYLANNVIHCNRKNNEADNRGKGKDVD